MKFSVILLIIVFQFLVAPMDIAHAERIQTGGYFTERQEIVETDTEIGFTEESITLLPAEKKCFYVKVRWLETKEKIPHLRPDPEGLFLKYSGNFEIENNTLILKLTTRESGESEGGGDTPMIMRLIISDQSLVEVGSNKIFKYVRK
jgi:hypothetical protein